MKPTLLNLPPRLARSASICVGTFLASGKACFHTALQCLVYKLPTSLACNCQLVKVVTAKRARSAAQVVLTGADQEANGWVMEKVSKGHGDGFQLS